MYPQELAHALVYFLLVSKVGLLHYSADGRHEAQRVIAAQLPNVCWLDLSASDATLQLRQESEIKRTVGKWIPETCLWPRSAC